MTKLRAEIAAVRKDYQQMAQQLAQSIYEMEGYKKYTVYMKGREAELGK